MGSQVVRAPSQSLGWPRSGFPLACTFSAFGLGCLSSLAHPSPKVSLPT